MKANISVCIVTKNNESSIEQCLRSIRYFTKEIIVVDANSTDNTLNIVKKYADKIEVIDSENISKSLIYRSFDLAENDWKLFLKPNEKMLNGHKLLNFFETNQIKNKMVSIKVVQENKEIGYSTRLFNINDIHLIKEDCNFNILSSEPTYLCNDVQLTYTSDNILTNTLNIDIAAKEVSEDLNKLLDSAKNLIVEKNYAGAVQKLASYIEATNDKLIPILLLAKVYNDMLDVNECELWLFRALSISTSYCEPYLLLSKLYSDSFAKTNSTLDLEKSMRYGELCALVLKDQKEFCYQKLSNNQDDPVKKISLTLHYFLNIVYYNLGQYANAFDSVNEYLKHEPNNTNMMYNRDLYSRLKFGLTQK